MYAMIKLLKSINTYVLYVLVFSVTFENWDPFKLVGTYSITYLTSILYIGTWIPLVRSNFNVSILKKYVIPLLLFILVGFVSAALHSGYAEELKFAYNYRVLLLIILMMLIASHISNNALLINRMLNAYIASIMLVFMLVSIGEGVGYENGRLLLFGENPNLLGMKAAIAFLIIVARIMDNKFSIRQLFIAVALCIPLFSLILLSGSRGAFLSVFLGFGVLIFFKKMGFIKKLSLITLGIVLSGFLLAYVMESNDLLRGRIMRTVETGETGRNDLWVGAAQIIENNLVLGVGFPGVLPEMYKYSGRFIDPHNVFLYVLISTGLIGFCFYMIFILRVMKNQYIAYKYNGQTVYMVIYAIMLFNMFKAGGGIGKILFWFFFSVLIAANTVCQKECSNKTLIK